jgi:hypothetical protein
MNSNNQQQNKCNHNWKRTGFWDGIDTETGKKFGGPMAVCQKCGKKKKFTHEDWQEQEENKNKGFFSRFFK